MQNRISFTPFPTLYTERFVLREITGADEQDLYQLRSDPASALVLDRPLTKTVEDARAFMRRIWEGTQDNQWVFWAITPKGDANLLGTVCLWNISPDGRKAELGYELLPTQRQKGFMQEVLAEVIRYGFSVLKLQRLEAVVHPRNVPSVALLNRNGFYLSDKRIAMSGPHADPAVQLLSYCLENS